MVLIIGVIRNKYRSKIPHEFANIRSTLSYDERILENVFFWGENRSGATWVSNYAVSTKLGALQRLLGVLGFTARRGSVTADRKVLNVVDAVGSGGNAAFAAVYSATDFFDSSYGTRPV